MSSTTVYFEGECQFEAEFSYTPRVGATREEPADGGAVCEGLWVDIYDRDGNVAKGIALDPDQFPALIAHMTEQVEEQY
jgi:hypothetical protein